MHYPFESHLHRRLKSSTVHSTCVVTFWILGSSTAVVAIHLHRARCSRGIEEREERGGGCKTIVLAKSKGALESRSGTMHRTVEIARTYEREYRNERPRNKSRNIITRVLPYPWVKISISILSKIRVAHRTSRSRSFFIFFLYAVTTFVCLYFALGCLLTCLAIMMSRGYATTTSSMYYRFAHSQPRTVRKLASGYGT